MKKLILSLAFMAIVSCAFAQEIANFAVRRPVVSPEITATDITFRISAPEATTVKLAGSWIAQRGGLDMTKDENGVWSVTVDRPATDLYTYSFTVNGVSVNDANNVLMQRDGSRFLSVLMIPGPETENLTEAAEKRGDVESVWYPSSNLGQMRRMTVYTPYGYKTGKERYPVMYLLHGGGGDEEAWMSMGRAVQILDNMIEKGLAEPMICVMPNGNPTQLAAQTLKLPNGTLRPGVAVEGGNTATYSWDGMQPFRKEMLDNIVPYIDANYRTIADAKHRAICGLSMGGGQSFYIGLRAPEVFRNVGFFSTGAFGGISNGESTFDLEKEAPGMLSDTKKFNSGLDVLFVTCGEQDSRITATNKVVDTMKEHGVKLVYETYPGNHEWRVWRRSLQAFLPMIFK